MSSPDPRTGCYRRWFTTGLTLVRRELQRRRRPGVKPAFEPDLFCSRFALLKSHDHLTRTEQRRLLPLIRVYRWPGTLYKELYGLHQADDLKGFALDALERFADLYETGAIPHYQHTVDTILNWADEILSWHHTRRSNRPLEGINNLLQTLRRTAHGFTNPSHYSTRGLLLS